MQDILVTFLWHCTLKNRCIKHYNNCDKVKRTRTCCRPYFILSSRALFVTLRIIITVQTVVSCDSSCLTASCCLFARLNTTYLCHQLDSKQVTVTAYLQLTNGLCAVPLGIFSQDIPASRGFVGFSLYNSL